MISPKLYGYAGSVLRLDLTSGGITREVLDEAILRKYVGCWGLSLRYLYDLLPPGYTATDPENPLVFMTGPLTGLHLPGATNITLATKNFDTGFTVGRSHSHGSFGIILKAAGYDGIIITGKSDKPVYLWIHGGKAEIRDASHLWGRTDTHETEDAIKEELGGSKISVAAIGPAGENLVRFACVVNPPRGAAGALCLDRRGDVRRAGGPPDGGERFPRAGEPVRGRQAGGGALLTLLSAGTRHYPHRPALRQCLWAPPERHGRSRSGGHLHR